MKNLLNWLKTSQKQTNPEPVPEEDEKGRKLEFDVPIRVIFSVGLFNDWFCWEDNGAAYANAGIFGRTSKLSPGMIDEYLLYCFNLTEKDFQIGCGTLEQYKSIFMDQIKKDWRTRK